MLPGRDPPHHLHGPEQGAWCQDPECQHRLHLAAVLCVDVDRGSVVLVYRAPSFRSPRCITSGECECQVHHEAPVARVQPAQQFGATAAVPPQGGTAPVLPQRLKTGSRIYSINRKPGFD